ncbi:hypothetical protein TWF694_003130 [Orbilia ellipsospora]|uniref:BTB domain-containing protein n=1 Tax=Orbilia ellipsospora TaxID=2528407 RepID=A0AAV9X0N6_9PEZI
MNPESEVEGGELVLAREIPIATPDIPKKVHKIKYLDIHPTGDISVRCCSAKEEDENRTLGFLRVSSHALSLASPVFRAMLDPAKGFKESQPLKDPDETREISLETHSMHAIVIVMRVIHHKNLANGDSMALIVMFHVATICDQYQLHEAVRPTMDSWVKSLWPGPNYLTPAALLPTELREVCSPHKRYTTRTAQSIHREAESGGPGHHKDFCRLWLWIAKVFNYPSILEECGEHGVFEIRMLDSDSFTFSGDDREIDPLLSAFVKSKSVA